MNRIGYNLETRITWIHVIQMTKNRVARRNNPAGYIPVSHTHLEVVAQTYGETGGFFTSSTRGVGRASLAPGGQSTTVIVIDNSVVGIDPNSLVQFVLNTDYPHIGISVISVGVQSHPHGFQRSGVGQFELTAQTEDVVAVEINNGGIITTVVITGLVETNRLEGIGQAVSGSQTDCVTLAATYIFFHLLIGQRCGERAVTVVQRHAEGIAVMILGCRLTFIHRVGENSVEATKVRCGVLNSVIEALIETGVAGTSQVAHITDLVTEQVGRTTGLLERAVKTTSLDSPPVIALQADKGVTGSEIAATAAVTSGEVDLLLDLEEGLQAGVDFMIALETDTGGVAGQVGFGVVGTVVQEIHGHVGTTIDAHISQRQSRHDSRSTNSNRNQLLFHREKLLRVCMTSSCRALTSSFCFDGSDYGKRI